MSRKILLGTMLILIMLICSECTFNVSAATATGPPKLKIYVGPISVLADNRAYNIIAVQLQDSTGVPVRAKEDTMIRLSSSLTTIGTVDSTTTILKGNTRATANFYSTYTPGSTTITAAASGYVTVQASVTTVGPIPSVLAVYGFPPVLPANGDAYGAVTVQLQDSSGYPAKAPIGGVQVTLSSSNNTIAQVSPSVTIIEGRTYTVASIKTTSDVAGSAVVTAISSGYTSKQVTITTQRMAADPTALKVYLGPPKLPADGDTYQIVVQLQNSSGSIIQASQDVTVTLSSSADEVGTVEQTITIPQAQSYALANFTTTYKADTTTITAAATDCKSSQASLTTVGPVPSKLAVYCLPSSLPADGQSYDVIQVQLQDSRGKPAMDPLGDITLYLFSSTADSGNVSSTLTIPFGETYAVGTFVTTCAAISTTITAQSSGYDPGQAKITTYLIDQVSLNVSVTADSVTVNPGEQTTIRAYVEYNGSGPATKATLSFTSNKGGSFAAPKEEGNGYYTSVFTAPNASRKTVCLITANASKTGYNGTAGNVSVTVERISLTAVTIQLRVVEDNGIAVSEASVTSTSKPTNQESLNGVTNGTGCITFANVSEGTYTIQITKQGYDPKTETIQFFAGQTAPQTVSLSKTAASIFSLPVIIVIVVIAVVAVLLVFLVIRKRRNAEPTEQTG